MTPYRKFDDSSNSPQNIIRRLETGRFYPLLFALLATFVPLLIIWYIDHLPSHRARARNLVQETYMAEQALLYESDKDPWGRLHQQYGKVISFQVSQERFTWMPHQFIFEISVQRRNARTKELVQVHTNKIGDYARIDGVTVHVE